MIESYWLQTYVLACARLETTSFQHHQHLVAHHEIYESTGSIQFPLWGHVHWWNSCICRRSWCKAPGNRKESAIVTGVIKMWRHVETTKETREEKLNFLIFLISFSHLSHSFHNFHILLQCRSHFDLLVERGSSWPRHCWHCPDFLALLSFLPGDDWNGLSTCSYLKVLSGTPGLTYFVQVSKKTCNKILELEPFRSFMLPGLQPNTEPATTSTKLQAPHDSLAGVLPCLAPVSASSGAEFRPQGTGGNVCTPCRSCSRPPSKTSCGVNHPTQVW